MAKRKKKIFDIDVEEVSLVDEGANNRRFMFRKSADGEVFEGSVAEIAEMLAEEISNILIET